MSDGCLGLFKVAPASLYCVDTHKGPALSADGMKMDITFFPTKKALRIPPNIVGGSLLPPLRFTLSLDYIASGVHSCIAQAVT